MRGLMKKMILPCVFRICWFCFITIEIPDCIENSILISQLTVVLFFKQGYMGLDARKLVFGFVTNKGSD